MEVSVQVAFRTRQGRGRGADTVFTKPTQLYTAQCAAGALQPVCSDERGNGNERRGARRRPSARTRQHAGRVSHSFGAPVHQAVVWRVAARVRAVLVGSACVWPHESTAGSVLPLQRSLPPGRRLLLQLLNPSNAQPAGAFSSRREAQGGQRWHALLLKLKQPFLVVGLLRLRTVV